jgi:hypothetical protein
MEKILTESPVNIPVIIDDVKDEGDFKMSRCTYFSVASTLFSADQSFDLFKEKIPYLMVGVTGVISQPSEKSQLFDDPQKIAGFFDAIEEKADFYVDINDIWLPNYVFSEEPKRGKVFRISLGLYKAAFRFQNEQITESEFLDFCQQVNSPGVFSPGETEAFSVWGKQQIEGAREHYHTKKELWLKHVDDIKVKSFEEL